MNVRRGHEDARDSSPDIPPNHTGVQHSLHPRCTAAAEDRRIGLGSQIGSGPGWDRNRGG